MPLPAPVMLSILELSEHLFPIVHWDVRDPKLLLVRAVVASMVSYIFFNRGECRACALSSDLVVDKTHTTLLLRKEKGMKNLQEGYIRTRQVPCDKAPRIATLLAAFITRTLKMGQQKHRWALSPAKDKEQWSSYTLSGWLSAAFIAASQRSPEGFAWTSHSLRKGSASAANAIGV